MRKIDTSNWTDEEIAQGYAIRRRGGKSVIKISLESGEIEHLGRTNDKHEGEHKLPGTKMWVKDDYEERLKKYKEISSKANSDYRKKNINKETRDRVINEAHDKYIKGKPVNNGEWKEHGWGEYSRNTDDLQSVITSGKKADGTSDYVRTDYDKYGNELRSNTYKTLDEAKKTDYDVDQAVKSIKDIGNEKLTDKARDEIIAGYDDYDYAIEKFSADNRITKKEAEKYFEDAGKKLGLKKPRITGEDDELKSKYMQIPEKERAQAYADGKNWRDLVKEKEKEYYEKVKNGELSSNQYYKPGSNMSKVEQEYIKKIEAKVKKNKNDEKVRTKAKGIGKVEGTDDYVRFAKRHGLDIKDSNTLKQYLAVTRKHKKN